VSAVGTPLLSDFNLKPLERFEGLLAAWRAQLIANGTSGMSTPSSASLSLIGDAVGTSIWVGEVSTAETPPEILMQIKDRSGLTWDQIARAMGVNRRSVHFWLNGRDLSAEKEERLHAFASIVRTLAGDSQRQTRSRLLDRTGGESVFDLVIAEHDSEAAKLARTRAVSTHEAMLVSSVSRRISDQARAARRSPIEAADLLVGASQRVVVPSGELKRARRMTRRTDGR
jgi:hypothetical protein